MRGGLNAAGIDISDFGAKTNLPNRLFDSLKNPVRGGARPGPGIILE